MAQYHLRVAAGQLHVRFHRSGELTGIPLDAAEASETLKSVMSDLDTGREVAVSFPEGLLELWLQYAPMSDTDLRSLSTDALVHYRHLDSAVPCLYLDIPRCT